MKRFLFLVAGLAVAGLAATLGVLTAQPAAAKTASTAKANQAVLYKSTGCMCCEDYAKYLRTAGLNVKVKAVSFQTLAEIDKKHGVPLKLAGCHTMLLDGYVTSGHIPVDVIHKLLAERLPIQGITLPGMPLGSPGMSGTKQGPLTIYAFAKNHKPWIYAKR
jgi:hypothetical protein